jgi:hypothetical protein
VSAIFKRLDIIDLVCTEILGSAFEHCVVLWLYRSFTEKLEERSMGKK